MKSPLLGSFCCVKKVYIIRMTNDKNQYLSFVEIYANLTLRRR
ncbi:hypothetical protein PIL02S_03905 [Paenibacillus illinoisensis]|uniref:Uncharacterized protein n=1 Tax=Paenibacillus illinoisensis TaxID=59845 RepID=A0A2W0C5J6_9BACL|nr:hypothetical protein PIL02S_03905 [Paenibacillus illinoisensis]